MSEKKLSQSGQFQKPAWDWTQVECVLKTSEHNRRTVQWQLAPSIFLTNPTSTSSDPNVRLFIDTEKSLTYTTDLGWNWHKSWNLPNISIRLEIKDEATGEQLLTPKNIYAQIFAVKKNGETDRSEKVTLLDVGIRGESKMQMVDGQVYFSAMKFSSTSYNNEGQNFHLLIVIYIQENQSDKPKVLTAVISPQIFVDSRRSARDYHEKKFNSFVEPFSTDQLEKEFIKRENKSRTEQEIEIKNDPEGFYNYLTAPNIRHKVKHPIFLAIRFSNCISILYNQEKIAELLNSEKQRTTLTAKDIIEMLQKKLLKQSQTKNVRQENQTESLQQKLFLFVVRNVSDSLKRKKVMESIQTLQSQSFSVVQDEKLVPTEFKKFADLDSLPRIYKDNFELLRQLCKKYVPSDEESGSDESDEQYGKQQQYKKVKVSKIENGNGYTFSNNSGSNKKPKTTHIVCQTIQTMDNKPNSKNVQEESKSDKKSVVDNSNLNNNVGKVYDTQRQIKKEETYVKETNQQNQEQVPFSSVNNTSNLNNNNQKIASYSLNLGSKKGSAFNNCNFPPLPEPIKHMLYNPNNPPTYPDFYQNASNPFGIGNMATMGNLSGLGNYAMNGLSQNVNGMAAMTNMNGMNGMPTLNPMSMMQGIPGVINMSSLQNVGGMQGLQGMQGFQMMPGMPGVGHSNNMTGVPGMNPLNGMNISGFQGLNTPLNGFMGNGNAYSTFPQANMTHQGKTIQNLLCSNLLLSNWLNSVKSNNVNLMESIKGGKANDEQMKPTETKDIQEALSDLSRISQSPQLQEQQSMLCLMQQINLYRELLSQVTYQNQLLGSNVNSSQGGGNSDGNEMPNVMKQEKLIGFRGFQGNQFRVPKQQHQE